MFSHHTTRGAVVLAAVASTVTAAFVLLPAGSSVAAGTTYWVDDTNPACNDSGAADSTTPTCTISAAVKKATQPGDTVHVVAGSYGEQVNIVGSGTSTDPISLVADRGATVLGTTDLTTATWTATATTAWTTPVPASAAPAQVLLDGAALTKAGSATTTTSGSWFYDTASSRLSVDVGGSDPSSGHTVTAMRNYGVNVNGKSDVVVRGITATGQALAGFHTANATRVSFVEVTASASRGYGIHVDSTTGARVSQATVTGNRSVGIRLSADAGAAVTDSVSHNNVSHGVSVQGSSDTVVDGVRSYDNGDADPTTRVATGIDVSFLGGTATAPGTVSTGTVVENSTVYDNEDSGMQAYTGSTGTVFRRNLSYGNGDHGIDNLDAKSTTVVSNTVVGNVTAGINFEGNAEGGSTGATTRDNIVVDNAVSSTRTVGQIRVDATSVTGSSLDRDLLRGPVLVAWGGTNNTGLAALRSATGQEMHGLTGDPGFVDLAGRDLHLAATSPALDAAFSDVPQWQRLDHDQNPPTDLAAVPNTGTGPDATADLGALERVDTSSPPPPPPPPSKPVALGTLTPTQGTAPLDVHVDGTGSTSSGSTITGYHWTCGNGTTVSTPTGTCSYPAHGTYPVTLTVSDATGATAQWTGSVAVTAPVVTPPPDTNPPPTTNPPPPATNPPPAPATVDALLSATPRRGYAPLKVLLDATRSATSDGTPIASYAFGCGNGTGYRGPAAVLQCRYRRPGRYLAQVTVTDAAGNTDRATVVVRVRRDVPPTAVLVVSTHRPRPRQLVVVDGTLSHDPDRTPVARFRFACGNGVQTAWERAPRTTCHYRTGRHTIRMWVRDTAGHTAVAATTVAVRRARTDR